eukprot:SAG31_NODE_25446_length_461_cov_0.958564_1_plen_72_part_00
MHYAEAVRLKVQKRVGGLLMNAPEYESPQHLAQLAGYVREGDWRLQVRTDGRCVRLATSRCSYQLICEGNL